MLRRIVARLNDASRDGDLTEAQLSKLGEFMETLDESGRKLLLLRMQGLTPAQIGAEMGMESKDACWALAKIYADLRSFIPDSAQPPCTSDTERPPPAASG